MKSPIQFTLTDVTIFYIRNHLLYGSQRATVSPSNEKMIQCVG